MPTLRPSIFDPAKTSVSIIVIVIVNDDVLNNASAHRYLWHWTKKLSLDKLSCLMLNIYSLSWGSSTRLVKFSNGPNTISEWSNLLYSLTTWYPESLKIIDHNLPIGRVKCDIRVLGGCSLVFCQFLNSFGFVCPSMLLLLHIIPSICICHW